MKKALITGITGQDGSYLTELLIEKGYEVHGIKRRSSLFNTQRIDHLYQDPHHEDVRLKLHFGDLTDSNSITKVINKVKPDEIYNLGAMSQVMVSFEIPEYTAEVNAMGTLRVLEAVKSLGLEKKTKIYQASSSELYGHGLENPQNETTPFYPRSPYGVSKLFAHWIGVNYREAYGMFVCNGILFNHESSQRGETFVTRKITRGIAQLVLGLEDKIYLGNLNASRDWGHAKDYVYAMWLMLQHSKPDDYVIATGITTTVREFVVQAFLEVGIEIAFRGEGIDEKGVVQNSNGEFKLPVGKEVIAVDPSYFRPAEVNFLKGDASKAREILKWKPKYELKTIITDMVRADIELFTREKILKDNGHLVTHCRE